LVPSAFEHVVAGKALEDRRHDRRVLGSKKRTRVRRRDKEVMVASQRCVP
jgi:hypothetical protein